MSSKKKIAILGSTGSIGRQCLEIVEEHPDKFEIVFLMAGKNTELLADQAEKFKPKGVLSAKGSFSELHSSRLTSQSIQIHSSGELIHDIIDFYFPDLLVIALPSLSAYQILLDCIKVEVPIALANKESYLLLGDHLEEEVKNHIWPLDSEPIALFQCLRGENPDDIDEIFLTASGGPFYNSEIPAEEIKKSDVLNHPVWSMGDKITVDSATMMNKAFEIFEIHKYFKIDIEKIKVVLHPEAHVHSMVRFKDGNIKILSSKPDMKHSLSFVMNYPERLSTDDRDYIFDQIWNFKELRKGDFPIFDLAMKYILKGGSYPAAIAVIDDFFVEAFLQEKIRFMDIEALMRDCLERVTQGDAPTPSNLDEFVKECQEICTMQIA